MNDGACDLRSKTCVPCEGGVPQLTAAEAEALRAQVPAWTLVEAGRPTLHAPSAPYRRIERGFVFRDFASALAFVNAVGAVAEAEGHHPDILVHSWRKVSLALTTHAIKGLSENDFILAAKIDAIGGAA